ncbi:unnamed protein product [Ciceribacter selenitireducens ATCC BAA-1503]|uniref:Uncharacterized protein n=1 Tax=Ciceribacter selenitireducens ATCC BAA-1503 TaxID=1336235 RepID=A0A376AH87_9HYPH|nr:unnamed protein product [Ciceribacter selenitireducens ATCC BAA-1503]
MPFLLMRFGSMGTAYGVQKYARRLASSVIGIKRQEKDHSRGAGRSPIMQAVWLRKLSL